MGASRHADRLEASTWSGSEPHQRQPMSERGVRDLPPVGESAYGATSVVSCSHEEHETTLVALAGLNDDEPPSWAAREKKPAATYSPRPLRAKYHRRCGA